VGLYIKSMAGRGGLVADVLFEDVAMQRVVEPIRFAMQYGYSSGGGGGARSEGSTDSGGAGSEDDDAGLPVFRNFTVRRVRAVSAARAGAFAGLEGSPIDGVALEDVVVSHAATGFSCAFVSGTATGVTPEPCF